jgi:molecular chaperone DnaK (HSP70)
VLRFGGQATVAELSRGDVEDLTSGLLARTIDVIDRTLATARGQGVTHFDEVLLVGGMSRFPAVTRVLRERLGVDTRLHEPELAVAKGAALYARALKERASGPPRPAARGGVRPGPAAPEVSRLAAARVADVVPRAFGVIGLDGRDPLALTDPLRARKMVVHLLLANTVLPADTGPYTFVTAIDNQRMVGIEVWEQPGPELSDDPADNRKVGEGMLRDLPAGLPAGSRIEVTFFMSETGRLTVHAKEPGSGTELRFDLQIGDFDRARLDQAKRSVAGYEVNG